MPTKSTNDDYKVVINSVDHISEMSHPDPWTARASATRNETQDIMETCQFKCSGQAQEHTTGKTRTATRFV